MSRQQHQGGTLKDRFENLKQQWEHDTMHRSDTESRVNHPAYREVVRMGKEVVPLIIEDIRNNGTAFWWFALLDILKEGPHIPEYARGRITLLNEMWVAWYDHHHKGKSYRS